VDAYQNGDPQPPFEIATIYNTGNAVQYGYSTYESLIDVNFGNTPGFIPAYSPAATYAIGNCVTYNQVNYQCTATIGTPESFTSAHWAPLIATPWVLRCASFIGATERASYTGNCIVLTAALNRQFGTTFRQPPWPAPYGGSGTWGGGGTGDGSDIYITNEEPIITSFVSSLTEATTSDVYLNGTGDTGVFDISVYNTGSTYNFIVNIPAAVYASINSNPTIANSIINGFLTPIVPAGITWSINPYS